MDRIFTLLIRSFESLCHSELYSRARDVFSVQLSDSGSLKKVLKIPSIALSYRLTLLSVFSPPLAEIIFLPLRSNLSSLLSPGTHSVLFLISSIFPSSAHLLSFLPAPPHSTPSLGVFFSARWPRSPSLPPLLFSGTIPCSDFLCALQWFSASETDLHQADSRQTWRAVCCLTTSRAACFCSMAQTHKPSRCT